MVGKRCITKPTLAVILATSDAVSVAPGEIIEILIAPAEGVRAVDVIWRGERAMMFVNDLKNHSQEVSP